MHFLFECGTCSNLYLFPTEGIEDSLKKILCPSCQSSYYFGPLAAGISVKEPTIEKIGGSTQEVTLPPTNTHEFGEVFWKCGICDSNYSFDLIRVTAEGIKITCTHCLSFFVLQKTTSSKEYQPLIMEESKLDSSSTEKTNETNSPPEIEDREVSVKFKLDSSIFSIKEITKKTKPPSSTHSDSEILQSFVKFQEEKRKFKLDDTHAKHAVQFTESSMVRKKNFLEKNMVKISIWIICATCFLFGMFSFFEKNTQTINTIEKTQPPTLLPPASPDRPTYGFPQMGE